MIARAFCSGPDRQSAALRGPGLALVGAIRALVGPPGWARAHPSSPSIPLRC